MKEIDIKKIVPGYNPRKYFDLNKLRASIKQKGILIPLIVRPKNEVLKSSSCKIYHLLNLETI